VADTIFPSLGSAWPRGSAAGAGVLGLGGTSLRHSAAALAGRRRSCRASFRSIWWTDLRPLAPVGAAGARPPTGGGGIPAATSPPSRAKPAADRTVSRGGATNPAMPQAGAAAEVRKGPSRPL